MVYLLDENVLRELHSKGNREVRAWYASVAEADLRISVMTFFEKRRGWERRKQAAPDLAAARLAELAALEAAYRTRFVPIDDAVTAEWARLLGAKDKNQRAGLSRRRHGCMVLYWSPETSMMSGAVTSGYSTRSRQTRLSKRYRTGAFRQM